MLLHEGAHCRARDHWRLWFRRAVETALWFRPAVRLAGQKAMAEAENGCDEAVVARAEADGTTSAALLYSSCQVRLLVRATRRQFEAFVPGVIPTAERIRRLVHQRPTFGVLPSPAAWPAVAACTVAALPGPHGTFGVRHTRRGVVSHRPEVVRDIVYASKLPGDYVFNLYLVRSDGSGLIRLTDDRAEYGHPQWSPSGNQIAVQSRPHRNTHRGVYILDADGARLQRIGAWVTHDRPSWSPDGSRLATGVHGDESSDVHRNIYVSTVDATESHRITDDLADYTPAAWSPEGRDIALVRRAPGRMKWELALIATDRSDLRIIADASARGVQISAQAWSPDGGRLAYLAYSGGSQEPCELRILDLGTLESTMVGVRQSSDLEP
ncbi:MAG: M56 family metallopeptidase [Candidatus Poribacteria bacterium]